MCNYYDMEKALEERQGIDVSSGDLDWTSSDPCPGCGERAGQCSCIVSPFYSDEPSERFDVVVDCSAGWSDFETGVPKDGKDGIDEVVTRLLDKHPDDCTCGGEFKAHATKVT